MAQPRRTYVVAAVSNGPGYLYWIRLGETRYVKIGIAKHVGKRLSLLQIGCPFPLHIMESTAVDNMALAEQQAHLHYAAYRVRGEWFLFPPGSFSTDTTETLEAHKTSRWAALKREIATLHERIRELDAQNLYLIHQLNQASAHQQAKG